MSVSYTLGYGVAKVYPTDNVGRGYSLPRCLWIVFFELSWHSTRFLVSYHTHTHTHTHAHTYTHTHMHVGTIYATEKRQKIWGNRLKAYPHIESESVFGFASSASNIYITFYPYITKPKYTLPLIYGDTDHKSYTYGCRNWVELLLPRRKSQLRRPNFSLITHRLEVCLVKPTQIKKTDTKSTSLNLLVFSTLYIRVSIMSIFSTILKKKITYIVL